jgi:hypothetical protein
MTPITATCLKAGCGLLFSNQASAWLQSLCRSRGANDRTGYTTSSALISPPAIDHAASASSRSD